MARISFDSLFVYPAIICRNKSDLAMLVFSLCLRLFLRMLRHLVRSFLSPHLMAQVKPITMEEVKGLIKKKDKMEEEIQSIMEWLQQPGKPGLRGGLVDKVNFIIRFMINFFVTLRHLHNHVLACLAFSHTFLGWVSPK